MTQPKIIPRAESQHRPLALDLTAAPSGFRIAFVGAAWGGYFETVATFPTLDQASAARIEARRLWADWVAGSYGKYGPVPRAGRVA